MNIFNSVPSQAWIAFIGVIIGSIFTLIGIWITNKASAQRLKIQFEHDDKLKKEALYRERLEELYIISHKYFNRLVYHQLPYKMVMKGEITFNEALDLIIEWGKEKDYEPQRVTMIIHMYFPELEEEYSEILKIRDNLNEIINAYKEQYKIGNIDGSEWLKLFQPQIELLSKKTATFEEKIATIEIHH